MQQRRRKARMLFWFQKPPNYWPEGPRWAPQHKKHIDRHTPENHLEKKDISDKQAQIGDGQTEVGGISKLNRSCDASKE